MLEIEKDLEILRDKKTRITVLKDIKGMVFNNKYAKNDILICP